MPLALVSNCPFAAKDHLWLPEASNSLSDRRVVLTRSASEALPTRPMPSPPRPPDSVPPPATAVPAAAVHRAPRFDTSPFPLDASPVRVTRRSQPATRTDLARPGPVPAP